MGANWFLSDETSGGTPRVLADYNQGHHRNGTLSYGDHAVDLPLVYHFAVVQQIVVQLVVCVV